MTPPRVTRVPGDLNACERHGSCDDAVGLPRVDPDDGRCIDTAEATQLLRQNRPEPDLVALEVVEPAVREVPAGYQDLGVVLDIAGVGRLVRCLPFECPLILKLDGPMALDPPAIGEACAREELQRLVLPLGQI